MKPIKPKRNKIQPQRLVIWAAKGMFKSASKLAAALKLDTDRKVLIVRSDSLRFKPRQTDINLNWGMSNYPLWGRNISPLNKPYKVAKAVNKLHTFQALQDKCNIPQWTTMPQEAAAWIEEGKDVICRTKLTGFGGDGIVYCEAKDHVIVEAPLYVQYKKKKKEFRVHVFKGEVIDVTQKKKRKDFDGEINTKIRNYANGWVYCRDDIVVPEDLRTQAILAVNAIGLDFGAVDIIYNEKENKSYVLEINTAPGLEGTTIEVYKNAILKNLQ